LFVYFESNENTSVKTSEATGNNGSRRNPSRQSHVITPAVNGTMQHGRRDVSEDRSKERRGLVVNKINGYAVNCSIREVKSKL
jgi:hypothetical protein